MSVSVLFVCLGNICRSPTAQGVMEALVQQAGLQSTIEVDSCGTAAFNVGKQPDVRALGAAQRAGYDISQQIARQIDDEDFQRFNYIVAMDRSNLINVQAWAPSGFQGEIKLLLDYVGPNGSRQIADPYYEDAEKFDAVIQQITPALHGLLKYIRHQHAL